MRLTRAATRALRLLGQRQGGHLESPPPSTTIDVLPEDVLLEIFDSCRQTFEQEPAYHEWTWNSNNGWFKLAHVCRKWRCVVLSSSSRLHLQLLFTSRRPPSAIMLTRLPPLPIVVEYSRTSRTSISTWKEDNRAAAALRYPNRVCEIAIGGSHLSDGVYRAMNRPFPILESLKLFNYEHRPKFEAPITIFKGSAPSLRRLRLLNFPFASVSHLLSFTTGLVELDLNIDTIVCLSPATSLLTHLQGMPCLRRLELRVLDLPSATTNIPVSNMRVPDVVPLPGLTHFQFDGSTTWFEALAAGLAAPFLQDLHISLHGDSPTLPHLSRFIGDVEGQFFAVQVDMMPNISGPLISMLTHSHSDSIDEPPRRIAIQNGMRGSVLIGTALGARLTSAEQLLLQWPWTYYKSWVEDPIAWRGFLKRFQNVKTLRVGRDLVLRVARFLLLGSGEPPLLLLPALEEIELRWVDRYTPTIGDIEQEVLSTLTPFIAARQRAGRPVKISWIVDPAPRPYW